VYRKVKGLAMTDARRRAVVSAPPANTTYRVYYYAGGKPIAMRVMPPNDATGTLYYLHSDHLGSTSVTTCGSGACGAAGTVVARQWYYPYGAVRGSVGTLPTQRTFTGQYSHDAGLGSLMYFNARYMSPALGRFVSADSIVPGAGEPQAFNRYAFVLNNPLKYTDPTGHEPCETGSGLYCTGGRRYSSEESQNQGGINPCPILALCRPGSNTMPAVEEELTIDIAEQLPIMGANGAVFATQGNRIKGRGSSVGGTLAQLLAQALGLGGGANQACGGDFCASEANDITGQWHHIFSRPVWNVLKDHPLAEYLRRSDLLVRARSLADHYGYETWHRVADSKLIEWLRDPANRGATLQQFLAEIIRVYAQNMDKFPELKPLLELLQQQAGEVGK
jgi:RHS repeat-associated protein